MSCIQNIYVENQHLDLTSIYNSLNTFLNFFGFSVFTLVKLGA